MVDIDEDGMDAFQQVQDRREWEEGVEETEGSWNGGREAREREGENDGMGNSCVF